VRGIDFAIRKAALDLGIPEEKAKVVVMEYWNDIYKKLLSGENSAITVRHVGTFAMSRYKLNNSITKRIKKIKRVKASKKITQEYKDEIVANDMKKLQLMLKHRNDIAIQYAQNFGNI
jgi:hypothetical protein